MRGKTSKQLRKFAYTQPKSVEGTSAKEHIRNTTILDKLGNPQKVQVKRLQKISSYRQIKKAIYKKFKSIPRPQRHSYLRKISVAISAF
jgi:hypothetical protein